MAAIGSLALAESTATGDAIAAFDIIAAFHRRLLGRPRRSASSARIDRAVDLPRSVLLAPWARAAGLVQVSPLRVT